MHTVPVALPGKSYDVVIGRGALGDQAGRIRALTKNPSAIVADEEVWKRHEKALRAVLPDLPVIEVPSGEKSKSWAEFERVSELLLAMGVERGGSVVAFGGGVVGDLAGFCAATLRRGCKLVQVPTTLLSQVDSSVGGKTAINTRAGKNLVGAFHQPSLVVIDTEFLGTLPRRELLAGYAEVVKYGALGDEAFFDWLEQHGGGVLTLDDAPLSEAIAKSCAAKAAIVADDEKEAGKRALLNLGHTFGHAIEAEGKYDGRILHGEGVAIGMAMAARFSVREGLCPPGDADRLERLLRRAGLPTRLADMGSIETTAERLVDHMKQDKKVESGALTLILLRRLGDAFVAKDQDPSRVLDFLAEETHLPAL
ncbi:3-dehydroquinate synthase [Parvularcula lutaonensis]|uniref:3-dehydroquinate synthase n=1 Tax=Parvularcula lutaonensis TaxID=491923 RepID=A0ABV7M7S0_9PROT|nr:3-dehydroquinate synthase [Parvularcula lutaonensis]GGY42962.1 3-dehydroquinate synthase [Parvularcula lutaonensis]